MTETPYLNQKFEQLEKGKQIPQNSVPKIQRVAHYLRDRKHFAKHYSPRLVSIGPIHHGAKNLQLGEKYKLMWAASYLERKKQDARALYQKIASNIKQLKELFAEDVIEAFPDDEKLSWMLLVDGCALLQILEEVKIDHPEEMNVNVEQLILLFQDVLLLENQIPYEVLKLLSGPKNDANLLNSVKEFLGYHPDKPKQGAVKQDTGKEKTKDEDSFREELPLHLLDQYRKLLLDDPRRDIHEKHLEVDVSDSYADEAMIIVHRNTRELKAAGIRVKRSNSRRISDVHFSSGWFWAELRLPAIMIDNTAPTASLNLIAYEKCPDFKNNYEICSYQAFMGSLIQHPDDVKELRSVGILHNALGNDEEVAKVYSTLSSSIEVVPNTEIYSHVGLQIEKHYRRKWRTWIARSYDTYFSSPGTIIAFYAAVAALLLTFIQTWCAIKQL
ncbi:hypothetical protein Fmac_016409 [Flemingia macrophylla]|uniref:Uncharacterized protein n=1 Tax=Flemingia macrophylla TaxID=520843 RepID=A0ABD1MHC9_9FABA